MKASLSSQFPGTEKSENKNDPYTVVLKLINDGSLFWTSFENETEFTNFMGIEENRDTYSVLARDISEDNAQEICRQSISEHSAASPIFLQVCI